MMRFCQYAESLAPYAASSSTRRIAWNVWEQIYAAHHWRRQMEIYTSDCAPMYPGIHGTVGTDAVSSVVPADSECSHSVLLSTRLMPNDLSSINTAPKSSASFSYRKREWSEVEPHEAAVTHLGRLRVAADF